MGLIGDVLTGIGNVGSAIGDFFTGQQQANIAQQNFGLQEQMWDWQRNAQNITWRREDDAVQRRAADMAAAGINPIMAAGSPASTSAPVHAEAPQMDMAAAGGGVGQALHAGARGLLDAITMQKDFAIKDAQVQALQAQANKANADANAVGELLPGNLRLQGSQYDLQVNQAKSIAFDVAKLKPAEIALKNQELANKLQDIKQSDWFMKNGDLQTRIAVAKQKNDQLLAAQGLSEGELKLASMALELDILRTNKEVAQKTVGARSAGAFVDVVNKMDMAKMLGMGVSNPQLLQRINRLLNQ